MFRPLALVLAFASLPLHAGDVYVWTDNDGRKQISDVVPDKYRARARKVDVPRAQAPVIEPASAAAGGTAAPGATQTATAPATADCNLIWQRYLDSRECLAFYEYALRGLDADPRTVCMVVPAPPAQCEPPTGISSK